MSVVVGTAGHIDHGKTTLLRALTGIDADRLPEEQRRGMTIEVGYAHLTLPGGGSLDFVDVPGHDRLVGNMLVGAGEIDAVLLVVAADDGPSAQTLEHLELLDALGLRDGLGAVTKADAAGEARAAEVADEVAALLGRTTLAGSPVHVVASTTGAGVDDLRAGLAALAERVGARLSAETGASGGPRLAIDRAFRVRGRGVVVTGSLRGGRVAAGDELVLIPSGRVVRIREVQARGAQVEASHGGRTALLLAGVEPDDVPRGAVLTADPAVVATSRVMVAMRAPAGLSAVGGRFTTPTVPADRDRLRLHLGTAQAGALVVRGPREAIDLPDGSALAILRLDELIAAAPGDRFALRRPSPGSAAGGGIVLDPVPPRGVSRRRLTPERAAALAQPPIGSDAARLEVHGVLTNAPSPTVAPDVAAALAERALVMVAAHHAARPDAPGMPLPGLRAELALAIRRRVTLPRQTADEIARRTLDALVTAGTLGRDGDVVRDPARAAGLSTGTLAAMERLVAAVNVPAPPPLADAAREAGCPPEGVRALEVAGRIVRPEDNLAWSAETYRELTRRALAMAAAAPLSPAAFRDATGTSRKYVLVILEDLDRRGLLRRSDAGHVLGPKTLERLRQKAARQAQGEGSA